MTRPRIRPEDRPRRRPSRVASLFAVVLLVMLPAAVLAWDAMAFSSADESTLLTWVNQQRASRGLAALTVDGTLAAEARSRAKDMGDRYAATGSTSVFSHQIPPDGHTVFDELRAQGYCFTVAGENYAWNNYPDADATTTVEGQFSASSTHMNNILGSGWTRTGIGAYKDAVGMHVYVELFAQPCSSTSPTPTPTPTPTPAARATPTPTPTPRPAATAAATPVPATAAPQAGVLGLISGVPVPTAETRVQPAPDPLIAPPRGEPYLLLQWLLDFFMAIIRSLFAMVPPG